MATKTQDDLDKRLAELGGSRLVHGVASTKQIKNPKFNPNDFRSSEPEYLSVDVEQWKSPEGHTVQAIHMPDGSWDVIQDEPPAPKPAATGTKEWRTEGTPDPSQPDGYDNSRPTMAAYVNGKRTGETRAPTDKEYEDWLNVGQRSRNPGGKTDADIAAEKKAADAAARQARQDADAAAARNVPKPVNTSTTEPFIVQAMPDGTLKTSPNPNYVGEKPQRSTVKGSDGKTYVVTVDKNGEGTATPIAGLPSEGPSNPTAPAPKLPNFVLGGSQQALSQYKDELQKGVSSGLWSQKWADDRWGEALQLAQQVNTDYATQQRETESTRAAEINLAGQKNTTLQNGMQAALDHVTKINGLLPEGSNLGAQGFAALLGLQMLQMQASGLTSIDPRGRPAAPPVAVSTADLNNPQALAARRAQIMANPVFRPAPVVPSPASTASAGASPAPAARPAATLPSLPANRPDQTQAAPQIENAINPSARPDPNLGRPGDPGYRPASAVPQPLPSDPNLGQPGDPVWPNVNQLPVDVPYPRSDAAVSMAPSAYPVLDQYAPRAAPAMPSQEAAPAPSYPVLAQYGPQQAAAAPPAAYPSLLYSQAASTPPWRMTPEQIAEYERAGVPEDAIWSPGRQVA